MELFHKKFKCEKCGQEFKTEDELNEHMKVHMEPEQPQEPQQGAEEQTAEQPQEPQQEAQPSVSEKPEEEKQEAEADSNANAEEKPEAPSEAPQQNQSNQQ